MTTTGQFRGWRLWLPVLLTLAHPMPAAAVDPGAADRLVAADPDLAALDNAIGQALAGRPRDDQKAWLAGRDAACPAALQPVKGASRDLAIDCLERLYEQRLAVLDAARNAAAWPTLRFRPALVEGRGAKMCEDLLADLTASFLGRGLDIDPLGEREIGFAPIAGLEDDRTVALRADIDPYNNGKPFPVVEWITDNGSPQPATVQYLGYASADALLAAIGRGVEPLTASVRTEGKPIADAGGTAMPRDRSWRFFRYAGTVYLLSPLQPGSGVAGDLAVYQLSDAARRQRRCLFDAHLPTGGAPDAPVAGAAVAAMQRAAAPLLPTGRLCEAVGEGPQTLVDRAAWRPWALDRPWPQESGLPRPQLALYLTNRALTGPEEQRQYQAYLTARSAAVAALAPYYASQFGRAPAEARHLAAVYLDRSIADRFVFDPDDDAVAALFHKDYADKHKLQQAALAGDTASLRAALRLEPAALAAGAAGALDENLLTDALDHADTLRALLDMGLDPNRRGASGRTPLMTAARLDLVAAAALLLGHGADPDIGAGDAVAQSDLTGDAQCMRGDEAAPDTPGRTALSYAVVRASPAFVRLLLDRHADRHRRDSAGRRPADYLSRRGGDPAAAAAIAAMLQ